MAMWCIMVVELVGEDITLTTLKSQTDGIAVMTKKLTLPNNRLNISIQTHIFYFINVNRWINHGAYLVIENNKL